MESSAGQGSPEVVPLNGDLADFDFDGVQIEELERRFEMALAVPPVTPGACRCPSLQTCGTYCSPPPPVAAGTQG
jgi:hypothetical protein